VSEPATTIHCIDCGGTAHLLSRPDDYGWSEGQTLLYRCEDCLDGWYLIHEGVNDLPGHYN
jgi:hypothetical protein